jgi:hypothetical protein
LSMWEKCPKCGGRYGGAICKKVRYGIQPEGPWRDEIQIIGWECHCFANGAGTSVPDDALTSNERFSAWLKSVKGLKPCGYKEMRCSA